MAAQYEQPIWRYECGVSSNPISKAVDDAQIRAGKVGPLLNAPRYMTGEFANKTTTNQILPSRGIQSGKTAQSEASDDDLLEEIHSQTSLIVVNCCGHLSASKIVPQFSQIPFDRAARPFSQMQQPTEDMVGRFQFVENL